MLPLGLNTVDGCCPCVLAQRAHLKRILGGVNALRRWRWCSFRAAAGDAKRAEQAKQTEPTQQANAEKKEKDRLLQWLDGLRSGYRSKEFANAFHNVGLERLSDLRNADDGEVKELKAELKAKGAKV